MNKIEGILRERERERERERDIYLHHRIGKIFEKLLFGIPCMVSVALLGPS